MKHDDYPLHYDDLYITTAGIPRTSIFDLPFNLLVACTRSGGWELHQHDARYTVIAGEFHTSGLRLDVAGRVIVDSLTTAEAPAP